MLSNSLIHLPSRTRRVLSNGHLLSSTPCSWWLQNAKSHCKIQGFRESLSRFVHKCFPTFSVTFQVEFDELSPIDTFSVRFHALVSQKYASYEQYCEFFRTFVNMLFFCLAFCSHQELEVELRRRPLDGTRRVLLGNWMRELESICGRIAQGFTKFDVFLKGFCHRFCGFLGVGDVWCKNRVAELMELVEFYWESEWESWKAFLGKSRRVLWKTCCLGQGFRNFWPPEALNWVEKVSIR